MLSEDRESHALYYPWSTRYIHVSVEEALKVTCPSCKAKIGQPCTYLPPAPRSETSNDRKYWRRYYQAGKPMQRVHNERLAARRRQMYQERSTPLRDRRLVPPRKRAPGPQQHPALSAIRAFETAEHEQLRDWLARNGHLFLDI